MNETPKFDTHKWIDTFVKLAVAAALAFLAAKTGIVIPVPQGAVQSVPCPCVK